MYIVFTEIGKRKLLRNPKYFRGPPTPARVRSGHHTNPIRLNAHGRPAQYCQFYDKSGGLG